MWGGLSSGADGTHGLYCRSGRMFFLLGDDSEEKVLQMSCFVWEGGCTHDHAYHSHQAIDLASLQSRDGARRVFAGPGSHSITKREAP